MYREYPLSRFLPYKIPQDYDRFASKADAEVAVPACRLVGHSGRSRRIITAASSDRFLITKRSLPTSVPDRPLPPLLRHQLVVLVWI